MVILFQDTFLNFNSGIGSDSFPKFDISLGAIDLGPFSTKDNKKEFNGHSEFFVDFDINLKFKRYFYYQIDFTKYDYYYIGTNLFPVEQYRLPKGGSYEFDAGFVLDGEGAYYFGVKEGLHRGVSYVSFDLDYSKYPYPKGYNFSYNITTPSSVDFEELKALLLIEYEKIKNFTVNDFLNLEKHYGNVFLDFDRRAWVSFSKIKTNFSNFSNISYEIPKNRNYWFNFAIKRQGMYEKKIVNLDEFNIDDFISDIDYFKNEFTDMTIRGFDYISSVKSMFEYPKIVYTFYDVMDYLKDTNLSIEFDINEYERITNASI